jgi:hypothetical protein
VTVLVTTSTCIAASNFPLVARSQLIEEIRRQSAITREGTAKTGSTGIASGLSQDKSQAYHNTSSSPLPIMSSSDPSSSNSILPALHHALSGASGTLISTCATYPLSLVTSRLQVQRQLAREGRLTSADDAYRGIGDALSRIWSEDGARALYTGLGADAAKSVLDSFLFFLFYEWFRARRMAAHRRRGGGGGAKGLGVLEELAVGMAAGACSRAFTTPISNVVTRKQTAALVDDDDEEGDDDGHASRRGMWAVIKAIRKEKGILGLWSGYSASLVLTLNPSITFYLQDLLKKVMLSEPKWEDPGPQFTFLLAALSKAIASSITYPFQTAKARLQVSARAPSTTVEASATDIESGNKGDDDNKEKSVDEQVEAKLNAVRALQTVAKRSIFGTIAHIVKTEGVGSLYAGIQGEILKGFFNHGTTMLAKSVVHKLLFKLYLVVVSLMAKMKARRAARKAGQDNSDGVGGVGGVLRRMEEGLPRALHFTTSNLTSKVREGAEGTKRMVLNMADGKPRDLDE